MSFREKRLERDNFAWNNRNKLGAINAFISTGREIIVNPGGFYEKLSPGGDLKTDLSFAVIMGSIPPVVFFCFFLFFTLSGREDLRQLYASISGINFNSAGMGFLITIASPLQVAVSVFFLAGLMHLFLRLTGWKQAPFPGTIRAIGYSTVAGLAALVPLVGSLFGTFWGLMLQTIGLKSIHNLTTGKALVTILLPPLLLGGTLALLIIGGYGIAGAILSAV